MDDVTRWLDQLAQGDEVATQRVLEHYWEQLLHLARRKLGSTNCRMADEEDVVVDAFQSFCQRATAGRFPRLADRHDLWNLLVTITVRKAVARYRAERSEKRGGGAVRGESVFTRNDALVEVGGIDGVPDSEPTPALAAQVNEQCERLFDCLQDESLETIARYKLEGYTNGEIARELDCVERTVERKLARIRKKWMREGRP